MTLQRQRLFQLCKPNYLKVDVIIRTAGLVSPGNGQLLLVFLVFVAHLPRGSGYLGGFDGNFQHPENIVNPELLSQL